MCGQVLHSDRRHDRTDARLYASITTLSACVVAARLKVS
jgi:hypothetical protein